MAKNKDKERTLKVSREKQLVAKEWTPIGLKSDYSMKLCRPEGVAWYLIYSKCWKEKPAT